MRTKASFLVISTLRLAAPNGTILALQVTDYRSFITKKFVLMLETSGSLLPTSLLEETIKSLNPLFLMWETPTQRLLARERMKLRLCSSSNPPRRSLQDFDHWRDRLLELHEEVYLAPPGSLKQLWADHRHPESWYVFWIGVVVLLLSLISCIASIIQAWASIKSLNS